MQQFQLVLLVKIAIGTATSVNFKVEWANSLTGTYHQMTIAKENGTTGFIDYTLAVGRFTGDGNYTVEIPIKYNYIKVSVIGVGVLTTTTVGIDSITGIA